MGLLTEANKIRRGCLIFGILVLFLDLFPILWILEDLRYPQPPGAFTIFTGKYYRYFPFMQKAIYPFGCLALVLGIWSIAKGLGVRKNPEAVDNRTKKSL